MKNSQKAIIISIVALIIVSIFFVSNNKSLKNNFSEECQNEYFSAIAPQLIIDFDTLTPADKNSV